MKRIASACLLGIECDWAARSRSSPALVEEFLRGGIFPVCPEVLGGMGAPRAPAEIRGGDGADVLDGKARIVDRDGADVTERFIEGAAATLRIARAVGAEEALLKERSPSCGCGRIYDGTFSKALREGDGVAAALLRRAGIRVVGVSLD